MDKIAIAVVGPGQIGKQHIALIRDNPACHLAALVAPDHTHQHQLAHELAVPLYHSVEQMLAVQSVDGVVVCSPNVFHVAQTSACVRAGVAVLVEKPLAHTYEDGLRLVELVAQTGAKVIVGHHRAHSPIMASARAIIAQGRLGRIVSITGSALFCKPAQYFADGPWRTVAGGGPILINLIHEIGNYRSLCGEITGVQAISSNAVRGFAVEDTVAIIFQFASGALGTFMLSDTAASARSWEQSSGENPAYPNYADEDCYVVAGTAGSLAIPTMRIKTTPAGMEPSWWTPFDTATVPVQRKNPLACQLEHFVNLIRGTEAPVVSAFDGLQNLRVAEAISNSAATRTMVML